MAKGNIINKLFAAGPLFLLYYLSISEIDTNLEKLFDDRLKKPTKNYFSAIGKNLLDNHEYAKSYKEENITVLVRAENSFQLHIPEALCYQLLC